MVASIVGMAIRVEISGKTVADIQSAFGCECQEGATWEAAMAGAH